jgi:hypothetical protein
MKLFITPKVSGYLDGIVTKKYRKEVTSSTIPIQPENISNIPDFNHIIFVQDTIIESINTEVEVTITDKVTYKFKVPESILPLLYEIQIYVNGSLYKTLNNDGLYIYEGFDDFTSFRGDTEFTMPFHISDKIELKYKLVYGKILHSEVTYTSLSHLAFGRVLDSTPESVTAKILLHDEELWLETSDYYEYEEGDEVGVWLSFNSPKIDENFKLNEVVKYISPYFEQHTPKMLLDNSCVSDISIEYYNSVKDTAEEITKYHDLYKEKVALLKDFPAILLDKCSVLFSSCNENYDNHDAFVGTDVVVCCHNSSLPHWFGHIVYDFILPDIDKDRWNNIWSYYYVNNIYGLSSRESFAETFRIWWETGRKDAEPYKTVDDLMKYLPYWGDSTYTVFPAKTEFYKFRR